jgi:hypothetical protein
MEQFRISFTDRNFGHHVCPTTAMMEFGIKILKLILPVIILLACYGVIGFMDSKAEAAISMSQQQMDTKIDSAVAKTNIAEAALVSCLNGVGIMLNDDVYVDCSNVKTLSKLETKKMLADEQKFQDNQVLPAMYWSNVGKSK